MDVGADETGKSMSDPIQTTTSPGGTAGRAPAAQPAPVAAQPAHRYTAALAGRIEQEWQDRWGAGGAVVAPHPARPGGGPEGGAGRPERFIPGQFPDPP